VAGSNRSGSKRVAQVMNANVFQAGAALSTPMICGPIMCSHVFGVLKPRIVISRGYQHRSLFDLNLCRKAFAVADRCGTAVW
jgi:hypothetical protein